MIDVTVNEPAVEYQGSCSCGWAGRWCTSALAASMSAAAHHDDVHSSKAKQIINRRQLAVNIEGE